jgi:peroxiredoxin (alkyl hydroperoxide reductase subunit C)
MASKVAPQMLRAFRAAPRVAPWAVPRAPAFRRFFAAQAQEQPRLRLGSTGMGNSSICYE